MNAIRKARNAFGNACAVGLWIVLGFISLFFAVAVLGAIFGSAPTKVTCTTDVYGSSVTCVRS